MINVESITTKFGTARIVKSGYWQISSSKEGNNGKKLHILLFEDYYKCTSLTWAVIHHKDRNKLNNRYDNLELMTREEHTSLHQRGKKFSDEHRRKIREALKGKNNPWYGKHHSDESKRKIGLGNKGKIVSEETKRKISESRNKSGYLNVSKHKDKTCKQGFTWRYIYYENGKRKEISSVDIEELEKKVRGKGLKWQKLEKRGDG